MTAGLLSFLGADVDRFNMPKAEASSIKCGQTLGPGGTFSLDSSLVGCADTGIVVTSAELDLNGHTVSCESERATGIRLEGKGSRVTNGTVTGCGFGVDVAGSGGHRVEKITATDNSTGFVVTTGSDSELLQNTASDCDLGFIVQVSNTRLSGNTAKDNIVSFIINSGTGNELTGNNAKGGTFGFQLSATGTTLTGNSVAGTRIGFVITGGENELTDNVATANNGGILVQGGAEGNRLHSNTSSGSAEADLVDENACDRNEWRANAFGFATGACIR